MHVKVIKIQNSYGQKMEPLKVRFKFSDLYLCIHVKNEILFKIHPRTKLKLKKYFVNMQEYENKNDTSNIVNLRNFDCFFSFQDSCDFCCMLQILLIVKNS